MANTSTSASASQPSSVAGWAIVTGIVVLANPRAIFASKKIVLDAQLYLGPGKSLVGSLRYFNLHDLPFADDGPNLYLITATFAQRNSVADVPVSGGRELSDYSFIGDIKQLVSLGPPGPRYLVSEGPTDDSHPEGVHLNDLPAFEINPCEQLYCQITGVAMECSMASSTFKIRVEQYISCSSEAAKKVSGSRSKPATCFLCHVPDCAKYQSWSRKPIPTNNRWVSICGFLTEVTTSSDDSEVKQFRIEVENVTYCGFYVPPVSRVAPVPQNSPRKSASLFSYGSPRSPPQSRNQDGA